MSRGTAQGKRRPPQLLQSGCAADLAQHCWADWALQEHAPSRLVEDSEIYAAGAAKFWADVRSASPSPPKSAPPRRPRERTDPHTDLSKSCVEQTIESQRRAEERQQTFFMGKVEERLATMRSRSTSPERR